MAASKKPKVKPAKPPTEDAAQSAVFLQTSKNLGVDESGAAFAKALTQVLPNSTSQSKAATAQNRAKSKGRSSGGA